MPVFFIFCAMGVGRKPPGEARRGGCERTPDAVRRRGCPSGRLYRRRLGRGRRRRARCARRRKKPRACPPNGSERGCASGFSAAVGWILQCSRRLIEPSLRTCAGSAEFCRQNETQVSAARYSVAADQTDNQIKTYISQRTDE